jgi:hypothetical protein
MNDSNPFQASSTPLAQSESQPEVDAVLYEMAHSLAQTKTWVRFLSVLGFIGTGCAVLFFAVSLVFGAGGAPGPMELIILIPTFLLFCVIPTVLLWNYANQIGYFLRVNSPAAFSAAITAQKSFWKYQGILVLIILIIYGMIFVFAGLAAVMG